MSFTPSSTFTPQQRLHDRATRGETLSPAEQLQLDAWYQHLEQDEMNVLFGSEQSTIASPQLRQEQLVLLQQQIDSLLTQLSSTMARIQELSAQNNALRADVSRFNPQPL